VPRRDGFCYKTGVGGAYRGVRTIVVAGVVLVVLVVGGMAGVAAVGSVVSTTTKPGTCSPRPCVEVGGYTMLVGAVRRGPAIVTVQVSLKVHGRSDMHTVPDDFRLLQGGHSYRPYVEPSAGCAGWPRTQIPNGGGFGPKVLCFRPTNTHAPLSLNWEPDLGVSEYFSSGYAIRLS
jgi:hypothetical protein